MGFSDWLSDGGGFPKSDPGFDGGGAPKGLLDCAVSGAEDGRLAGFLKIPTDSEVASGLTEVSFDAVKPLYWIEFWRIIFDPFSSEFTLSHDENQFLIHTRFFRISNESQTVSK